MTLISVIPSQVIDIFILILALFQYNNDPLDQVLKLDVDIINVKRTSLISSSSINSLHLINPIKLTFVCLYEKPI